MKEKKKWKPLKDTETKLIIELMKNSKASDRQLAKTIGVSQPTVSRIKAQLQRNGTIREFTAIPDMTRLGYGIMAFTFVRRGHVLNDEEIKRVRNNVRENAQPVLLNIIMIERGSGMDFDGVIVSYHTTYTDYTKFVELLLTTQLVDVKQIGRFIVDLKDEVRFIPLTFSLIAQSLTRAIDEKSRTDKP